MYKVVISISRAGEGSIVALRKHQSANSVGPIVATFRLEGHTPDSTPRQLLLALLELFPEQAQA